MHVFLTGATGLLGSEILVRLTQRPEVDHVTCLVRAKNGQDPLERLRQVVEFHGDELRKEAVSTLEGELGSEALSGALRRFDGAAISVVVNAAANTSFLAQNAAAIERTNVTGVAQLLSWAKTLPRLRLFLQISTAAICGADRPHRIVSEDEPLDPKTQQVVHYTASKLRAEILLRREIPDERLLIARPSILMGDSRGLSPRAPVVLWAVAAMNRLRLLPVSPTARLDVIPVDYAANAIVQLLLAERHHDVYHVSSGPLASTSAAELAILLGEYFRELPPFRFQSGGGTQFDEHANYVAHWERSFGSAAAGMALVRALVPYFKFMELDHAFDNRRLLTDAGVSPRAPAHLYLRNNLHHIAGIDVLGGSLDP